MRIESISGFSDDVVIRTLHEHIDRERDLTTFVVALIAEFDARQLYRQPGYRSTHEYCVHELRLSEDAAFKRIRVARLARRFPVIYRELAAGRLNLSSIVMRAPHLTETTADTLLSAAVHKTRSEIELLLAERFPQPDLPTLVQAAPPAMPVIASSCQLAPGPVGTRNLLQEGAPSVPASIPIASTIATSVATPSVATLRVEYPRIRPLAPERFGVQFTMSQACHDKLLRAQELLGHAVVSGDVPAVFERALDALIAKLESRKCGAASRPQRKHRIVKNARTIPAAVRREVRQRDGDQCTYVSETGRRCSARRGLEFDHIHEAARGGDASAANIRLRCRAHNQFTAECTFGAEFMKYKREEARRSIAAQHERTSRPPQHVAPTPSPPRTA